MQDTLQCVSQKVIEEDYSPKAMIDFSGKCKFIKPVEDKKQFDRFMEKMKEKSNFNSVNVALDKFARQANYLQLIEFLKSLNNEYKKRKATISELLQELKENIKDPIELESRIKKKEKEKTDMFNKSNEGIDTIFNKYTDNINGDIAKETQELEENYKNEINKFLNLEEWQIDNQTFDEMKKITMDIIEASKQFRDLMIRTAIKDCNEN